MRGEGGGLFSFVCFLSKKFHSEDIKKLLSVVLAWGDF